MTLLHDHLLPKEYRTFPQVSRSRRKLACSSAKRLPLFCEPQKEVVNTYELRRNTAFTGLIAGDTEGLAGIAASRAKRAPDSAPLWVLMPSIRKKMEIFLGKFIRTVFSPSGNTLIILSEKKVVVHPLDEMLGIRH